MEELTDVEKRRPHFLVNAAGNVNATPEVFREELKEVEEENPSRSLYEEEIGSALKASIEATGNFWAETGVNLWELARDVLGKEISKVEILKTFKHPLQPDIDILYGPIFNGKRSAPLVSIELKYFSKVKGEVIPKTAGVEGEPEGGFYRGIDQVFSHLTMGVDYGYLWHFIRLPVKEYEDKVEKGEVVAMEGLEVDEEEAKKLVEDHGEFSRAYGGLLTKFLKRSASPIGFASHGLIEEGPFLDPVATRLAAPNPFRDSDRGRCVRKLILDGLDVKEH